MARGLSVRTAAPVDAVEWRDAAVTVKLRGGDELAADCCLLTVPLGVLQHRA